MRDVSIATANWRSGQHFAFALQGQTTSRVTSLLVDYDSVLCGTADEITMWSAANGRRLSTIAIDGIPSSLQCSASRSGARQLVVGTGSGSLYMYDLQSGALMRRVLSRDAHSHWVAHLSVQDRTLLSSDGSSIMVCEKIPFSFTFAHRHEIHL